jgi:hypothetical protein
MNKINSPLLFFVPLSLNNAQRLHVSGRHACCHLGPAALVDDALQRFMSSQATQSAKRPGFSE